MPSPQLSAFSIVPSHFIDTTVCGYFIAGCAKWAVNAAREDIDDKRGVFPIKLKLNLTFELTDRGRGESDFNDVIVFDAERRRLIAKVKSSVVPRERNGIEIDCYLTVVHDGDGLCGGKASRKGAKINAVR